VRGKGRVIRFGMGSIAGKSRVRVQINFGEIGEFGAGTGASASGAGLAGTHARKPSGGTVEKITRMRVRHGGKVIQEREQVKRQSGPDTAEY